MKTYKVTYRSSLILFGDNIFTVKVEAENEKQARDHVSFEGQGMRQVLKVEEN